MTNNESETNIVYIEPPMISLMSSLPLALRLRAHRRRSLPIFNDGCDEAGKNI